MSIPSWIDPERALGFLAGHEGIHKLLSKMLASTAGKAIVTALCYMAAWRHSRMKQAELERLLNRITALRNFSENTRVNVFNEMQELSPSSDKLQWIARGFSELDTRSKAHLLRRLFYNIILRSIDRKIVTLRYGKRADFVPNLSMLLFAPADRCNLRCEGCVTGSEREGQDTPDLKKMNYVIEQAKQLNVFHVAVMGKGEPLYSQEDKEKLFALAEKHSDLNFAIFTNGTTLQERDAMRMMQLENIYPVVSIDGLREVNDARRGMGTYDRVMNSMDLMHRYKLIFGYCVTVYRDNYRHVVSSEFVNAMAEAGCKFGLYLRFLPLAKDARVDMILTEHDEAEFEALFDRAKSEVSMLLLDFDRFERWHGCRARRGSVIYVDGVTGRIAPCIKIPYSPPECNIYVSPHKNRLLEILRTDFFTCYRASYAQHKQCSLDFAGEIDSYLQLSNILPEEQERLRKVQEKLSESGKKVRK